jgi:hypothetical protein
MKDLDKRIENWTNQQQIVQSLCQIELKDFDTHAKFYQTCQKVALSSIILSKKDMQLMQLPSLAKDTQLLQQLDSIVTIQLPQPVPTPPLSRKNSRKPSMDAGDCTSRSMRDKENYKVGSPGRMAPRKIVC